MTPAVERGLGAETLGRLRRRAEQASAAGQDTFAVPEAAPVLERVALLSPPGPLRTEAPAWPGARGTSMGGGGCGLPPARGVGGPGGGGVQRARASGGGRVRAEGVGRAGA